MDDELAYRKCVKDINEVVELIGVVKAEPCLDRDLGLTGRGVVVDVVEETLKRQRLRQESRALALSTDGSRWAAEIEIHLAVANITQLFGRFDKEV